MCVYCMRRKRSCAGSMEKKEEIVMDDDVIERVEKGREKVSKPRSNVRCFV
jgi:hypothetical protein